MLPEVNRGVVQNRSASEGPLFFWRHPSSVFGNLGEPHYRCFEGGGSNGCTKVRVASGRGRRNGS